MLLCAFVYYKDKAEKEPLGLLAILFAAGAIFYFPALFSELTVGGLIDSLFSSKMEFSFDGNLTYVTRIDKIAHLSLFALAVGIIEEGAKWLVLYFITRKNKNFNYLFDGIVYATFLSLGFAIAENIHFAFENDVQMLGAKLLTSVPCHLFIGILMGYYYTMWHLRFTANKIENRMIRSQVVKEDKVRSSAIWLVALIILIGLNIIYFGKINKNAGLLLVPYLLWCIFALYLNIGIWILN
jgi:RsiW-degrading membrane proteinase PrsW (M82 family)